MTTEEKIIRAIAAHVADGHPVIEDVPGLAARILAALRPPKPVKEFVVGHVRCVRVLGRELGCRKGAATRYGWKVLDNETGRQVDALKPTFRDGVSVRTARAYAASRSAVLAVEKGREP